MTRNNNNNSNDEEEEETKKERKTSVTLTQYGIVPNDDDTDSSFVFPRDWPSGRHIVQMLHGQGVANAYTMGDETYWQASARWALLSKYGYLSSSSSSCGAKYVIRDDGTSSVRQLVLSNKDIDTIQSTWQMVVTQSEDYENVATNDEYNNDGRNDLLEFLATSKSCRRTLQWTTMECPSATQFKLHQHPNLELIYCASGTLYEIRMSGQPYHDNNNYDGNGIDHRHRRETYGGSSSEDGQQQEQDDNNNNIVVEGPNLTNLDRSWYFDTLHEGCWLVNEVGSIHKSFTSTSGSGCTLVVLWGGSHADIRDDEQPTSVNVSQAVTTMDHKLPSLSSSSNCCCSTTNGMTLSETFLPQSERSSQQQHDIVDQ